MLNTNVAACISRAKEIGANAFNYYAGHNKCFLLKVIDGQLSFGIDSNFGLGYTMYSDIYSCPWQL